MVSWCPIFGHQHTHRISPTMADLEHELARMTGSLDELRSEVRTESHAAFAQINERLHSMIRQTRLP